MSRHHTGYRMRRSIPLAWAWVVALAAAVAFGAGCASHRMVSFREVPHNPLVEQLTLTARGGPKPSDRTLQFLRVYDLGGDLKGDPQALLQKAQAVLEREPSAEKVYAIAELSYLQAKRVEPNHPHLALDLYGATVLNAYQYLFDDRFRATRNPYDPQFRRACDLYNVGLEAMLRLVRRDRNLEPGQTYTIRTAGGNWDITCVLRGGSWRKEDFGRFEFVSDYEIVGLKNHYHTYGLGVPLIVVRRSYPGEPPAAEYYPKDLSFPVTAFLRPLTEARQDPGPAEGPVRRHGVLELYDPLAVSDLVVSGVRVPLESDFTTPLAYFLSDPAFDVPTAGLLRPETLLARVGGKRPLMGLYMVQPYEPGKIPVVMVHGLWSSPITWMAMFNDLRSIPEIRDHFQFWFYLYPTGQPFWISAAQLRQDLVDVRNVLDPQRREPALDQMVLVGHSMGGLVSRLQTVQSGTAFWNAVSPQPLESVKAPPEVIERLRSCFFFEPNPSIRRLVTLGTPHRGSSFSNQTTQWLANRLIRLPTMLLQSQELLFRENKDLFPPQSLLRVTTSIDALSPDSPIFPVLNQSPRPPWVVHHNIVGMVPYRGLLGRWTGGDGVVSYQSAHVEDAASEVVVPADHSGLLVHPLAVLEVRRILLLHLAEARSFPYPAFPSPPSALTTASLMPH